MSKLRVIAGGFALLLPVALFAAGGGPDAAGWVFLDSTEADGPPQSWVDMSEAEAIDTGEVELPFSFELGGASWSHGVLDASGGLLFDGSGMACPDDADWIGFRSGGSGVPIRMRTMGRYPRRGWALDWSSSQLVLLESRSEAVIHVGEVDDAATIGAAASVGSGLPWACGGSSDLAGQSAWFSLGAARTAANLRSTDHLAEAWWGSRAAEFFGESVAAGDVNADGLSDVLVGQPELSRAHLFMGSREASTTESDAAALLLLGDGDRLGHSVALADVDGDGLDDAIVGAPDADSVGVVAVFLADSGMSGVRTLADADWRIHPPPELGTGAFGTALAVKDFNEDGVVDIAVGAPDSGEGVLFVGAAFIVDGADRSPDLHLDVSDAFVGLSPGDEAGSALAAMNGGLIVGAPGADGSEASLGVVYVLDTDAEPGVLESVARAQFEGASSGDRFGTSVAAGQLRSEGSSSLVVGAVGVADRGARTGAAYVFDGVTDAAGVRSALEAEVVITGPTGASAAGASIAMGALDEDPELELVVGATGGTSALGGGGMIGVFRSVPDGDVDLNEADHRLYSNDPGGELGSKVAIATDIQGDGHPDLLVAAPLDSPGARVGAGAVWLWPFVPAYLDEDGDGFVAHAAGGLDCDDADPDVNPNRDETVGDLVDNDCDGWVDDAVIPRRTDDGWRYDLDQVLGVSGGVLFDFEDVTEGEAVDDHYASLGMSVYASGAERAKPDVWGSPPVGALGVRVTADAAANDLVLTFGAPVDAVSLRILDAEADLRMDAVMGDELVVDGYHFEANGPDVPGGVLQSFTFARPIERFRIASATTNGWGVDNVEVVFSGGSDRDGDGLTAEDGDCDDFDATVRPGAVEILGDGIDNDCDGVLDGGEPDVFLTEGAFASAISIIGVRIDFEDLELGAEVTDQYGHLGVVVSGDVTVDDGAGESGPRDVQLGRVDDETLVMNFTEGQPAVAFWLIDADGTVTLEARRDGISLYEEVLESGYEGFVGMAFPYPVDSVFIRHSISGDEWGVDDITFSALGLDDADDDGFTEADGDCDDAEPLAFPGGEEVWYDGVDGDCAGDDDFDADGDGYSSSGSGGLDCDDFVSTTYPGAEDVWYDGVDADCRGDDDFDSDGDGYSSTDFGGTDCDDGTDAVHPGAEEVFYDEVDDDCDPTTDYDADGDGYAASGFPGSVGLYGVGDCDDAASGTHPDAVETWYDGIDEDCGGDDDFDADGDGHIPIAYGGDDCDDGDDAASPDHIEDPCYDGIDADCDGLSDYDCDGDGHEAAAYGGGDCADDDPEVYPGDGETPLGTDADCDGHVSAADGGDDCDDASASVHPGASEVWYDGVDADCDGADDYDRDGDGHRAAAWAADGEAADCNDADPAVHPSVPLDGCGHGDEDCDGESDEDCLPPEDTGDGESDTDSGEPAVPDDEPEDTGGDSTDTGESDPGSVDTGTTDDETESDTGETPEDPNADWEPPPSGVISSSGSGSDGGKGGCGCAASPRTHGWLWWCPYAFILWRRRSRTRE